MSNLTKITDELWALEIEGLKTFCDKDPGNMLWYMDTKNNICKLTDRSILGFDVLGTVSETEIDFDCEGLLNCKQFTGKHHIRLLLIEKAITPTPETKIVILKKI